MQSRASLPMRSRPVSAIASTSAIVSRHRLASSVDLRLPKTCSVGFSSGVAWQAFDGQPRALLVDPVSHAPTAMGRQAIPQQQHPTVRFETMQFPDKLDQGLAVVGARTQLKHEMSVATVGLEHQRCSQ